MGNCHYVDLSLLDKRHKDKPGRLQRCVNLAQKYIDKKIEHGRFLEIGAQHQQVAKYFPNFDHYTIDIKQTAPNTIVADITNCPEISGDSFDVVFSIDVFEHLRKPWQGASEIQRLLCGRGIVFVSTVFSWRYHPSPVDFWRFSPDALESLFLADCRTLYKGWDYAERRVNALKGDAIAIADELGGWRENVRVNYIGEKLERD